MLVLSAVVFGLAWWLGLYLAARDPRKPVLALTAAGLICYALAVAAEALRLNTTGSAAEWLGGAELVLVCQPGVAWFGVLLALRPERAGQAAVEGPGLLADPDDGEPRPRRFWAVAAYGLVLPAVVVWQAGGVGAPVSAAHVLLVAAIAVPLLVGLALVAVRMRALRPAPIGGVLAVATLFFGLGVAVLLLPFGLVPSWLALASIGMDLALLGLAVAVFDAFDEGQALRADMLRSLVAAAAAGVLFGGQVGVVLWALDGTPWLVALLFGSLAGAIAIQVLAGPLASLLDRLAFARSPALRTDRARLREAAEALPRRATGPLAELDEEEFARLTRRALSHYGDLSRLLASPLGALPAIDARLDARGAPDQPLERANELKQLLAESIQRLKPRDGGEFGTSDEWRFYNALYFPYVVGVRPYSQRATAAGLDPVARRAWQWFATSVPQRSLHNWQNAAARLVATDLRSRSPAQA